MNDTLEIPVEITYSVGQQALAATTGGLGIEHLIIFAMILGMAVLGFMFMQNQNKQSTTEAINQFRHEEANADKMRDLLERQKDMELKALTRQVDAKGFVVKP